MYPLTQEQNLPESATYNPDDERLFPEDNTLFQDSVQICEKGLKSEITHSSNKNVFTNMIWY